MTTPFSKLKAGLYYEPCDVLRCSPQRPHEGGDQRACWDVGGFVEAPIVGGEGSGQRALTQSDDEVDAPQEAHHIVQLQVKEVPLEQTLRVVLYKQAACSLTAPVRRGVKRLHTE